MGQKFMYIYNELTERLECKSGILYPRVTSKNRALFEYEGKTKCLSYFNDRKIHSGILILDERDDAYAKRTFIEDRKRKFELEERRLWRAKCEWHNLEENGIGD